ncbi:MAG: hypothetical protein H7836_06455 [Magnetococcus sp. YQC-3]
MQKTEKYNALSQFYKSLYAFLMLCNNSAGGLAIPTVPTNMKEDDMNDTKFLRTKDAARFLAVGRSTLEKLRLTGGGPVLVQRE